ncbi:Sodium/potassium-transporting ATPase subunit alpha-1 [Blomia tropicalis]|nr:Sodium/potassium-transporting ATPase subunit alpha-1 [Blomia tropicalis]
MYKKFKNKKKYEETTNSNNDNIVEHQMTIEEVCALLETNVEHGLDSTETAIRLERDGPNCFTPPKDKSWFILLLKELLSGFQLLMWFSAIGSFISFSIDHNPQDAYLALILIFTILLTGLFSYYQQMSSSKVFRSFKNMTPQSAFVLRDGRKQSIAVEDIVVGDIVYCEAGDRVPADLRIFVSNSMKVDNSSITGESEPLVRTIEPVRSIPLESTNLAFFSTNCTDGTGIGVVIATGDRTVMGDIASIVSGIEQVKTPIAKEISYFVLVITIMSVVSGILFAIVYYCLGTSFFKAFLFMIGITIGNVPEGLLPAMTVALTLTAKRMASKRCLVKHLEAVETLGSTSTICTDKTGTLTQNRMTVEHVWFGNETYIYRCGQLQHDVHSVDDIMMKQDWLLMKRCAMLCSRAEFLELNENDDNSNIEQWKTSGDASEVGIMKFLQQAIEPVNEYRSKYPKLAEKPFSSTYKYQYSIHREQNKVTNSPILVMKGAPERIISLCTQRMDYQGKTIPIDEKFIKMFEDVYHEYGSNGERVLAFCDLELDCEKYDSNYQFDSSKLDEQINLSNLRFLGLISMIDPPRPDIPKSVQLCRSAGIRVVMVTGDHPITAQAIAKTVNIISSSHRHTTITSLRSTISESNQRVKSIVIPGDELSIMTDEQLSETLLLYGEIVFARTTPKQKLRIVEMFQSLGEIVAVTGDGVNDSPALKKADIGIAMGISGSEVSKQAADMILLDDNFSTIITGIEEGRRIFDNMKKTVSYILAGNVTTIYPFVVYAMTGIPLAITTITALLISLGTDIVPAISLSYEDAELDIMNIPPRNAKTDRLVDKRLLVRAYAYIGIMGSICAYVGYFVTMNRYGYTVSMLWESRVRWESLVDDFPRIVGYDDGGHAIYQSTTYDERQMILMEAQTAYFAGIIVAQWIDVVVCKTRRVSNFRHGMRNHVLNFAILFETGLASFVIYVPFMNTILQTIPVSLISWLWTLPFISIILLLEEIRKWIIRSYPNKKIGMILLS